MSPMPGISLLYTLPDISSDHSSINLDVYPREPAVHLLGRRGNKLDKDIFTFIDLLLQIDLDTY